MTLCLPFHSTIVGAHYHAHHRFKVGNCALGLSEVVLSGSVRKGWALASLCNAPPSSLCGAACVFYHSTFPTYPKVPSGGSRLLSPQWVLLFDAAALLSAPTLEKDRGLLLLPELPALPRLFLFLDLQPKLPVACHSLTYPNKCAEVVKPKPFVYNEQHYRSLRYFPFRRVINKHVKVVERFLGRECKPNFLTRLFRRMYSVAWPHGRWTSQG